MLLLTNFKSVMGLFWGALMKRLGYVGAISEVVTSPHGSQTWPESPHPSQDKELGLKSRKFLSLPLHEPQCTLTQTS